MPTVRVLILRAPGTNCDGEAVYAFELAGAEPERVHVNRLREEPVLLREYQVLVIPGGFSYGDDVAAGKILANQLRSFLGDEMQRFRDDGKLILGICNGFQVLLKAGLLVAPTPSAARTPPTPPSEGGDENGGIPATLTNNAAGKFEDRWIRMKATPGKCPFVQGYDQLEAPIAHGEGRFVCKNEATLKQLEAAGQVVLRYVDAAGNPGPYPINPNGSQADIAGICDATGQVLGLMPHPERHVVGTQHPQWTRLGLKQEGDGLRMFKNTVNYFMRW